MVVDIKGDDSPTINGHDYSNNIHAFQFYKINFLNIISLLNINPTL